MPAPLHTLNLYKEGYLDKLNDLKGLGDFLWRAKSGFGSADDGTDINSVYLWRLLFIGFNLNKEKIFKIESIWNQKHVMNL